MLLGLALAAPNPGLAPQCSPVLSTAMQLSPRATFVCRETFWYIGKNQKAVGSANFVVQMSFPCFEMLALY